ncbi:nucleotidyltransferase domain-containing protein [Flavobacterium columnare]|uniref:nucleotidyltransferase domain-containing protein n=1 Tax=Flavobacterium columnare TaxID=996 RepID=UPI0040333055|nr:nucleotidyltransferase [Limnohabitans sp.]
MEQLYKKEISEYLEELGKELDITKSEHDAIVKSYEAVGDWLSKEASSLNYYSPKILPQGSFMLGTIVKPINPEDDIDIDLVCKLEKKPNSWTQKDLKVKVGDRLKSNSTYDKMLKDYKDGENYNNGGRRCWTLKYSDVAGYHMDILPSFSTDNLTYLFEKTFSASDEIDENDLKRLAIRITDTELDNYDSETDVENWNKSNPFGYAKWFWSKAMTSRVKLFSLNESVDPVRAYQQEKFPLQRVIQLLKRHRDIMFSSDEFDSENKPISIIITTLATLAYDRSENIIDAYSNIVNRMRGLIKDRFNPESGKYEKWVVNPINKEENFADKWSENKQKQDYFYLWLDKLEEDLNNLSNSLGKGQEYLFESFSDMYGEKVSKKVFSNISEKKRILRENGSLKMAIGTGILGSEGVKVKSHNFFGNNNE